MGKREDITVITNKIRNLGAGCRQKLRGCWPSAGSAILRRKPLLSQGWLSGAKYSAGRIRKDRQDGLIMMISSCSSSHRLTQAHRLQHDHGDGMQSPKMGQSAMLRLLEMKLANQSAGRLLLAWK